MPNTREIRRRIKSVKNTAQITKAMQMVAASKMRKAQQAALAGRPYANLLNETLAGVILHAGDFTHPLMEVREVNKSAIIVIATDKGLCGPLNSNLMREALRCEAADTAYVTAGKKAAQFITRAKRNLLAEFTYRDAPLFSEARAMSKYARDLFLNREVDRVCVLFTRFASTLVQKAERVQLLPVGRCLDLSVRVFGADGGGVTLPADEQRLSSGATEFQFEPDAGRVFSSLLPHFINFQLYQILLEAKASEHSARMVAMKNATDNAKQLIQDLTLEYNRIRQDTITKELLEIASAQV